MEVKSEKPTGGAEGRGAGEPSKSAQSRGNAAQMSGSKAVQKKSAAKNLGKENRQASGALKEGTDSAAKKGKNLNRLSEKKKVVRPAKKPAPQAAPVREPTRSKRKPPEIKFAPANPYEEGEINLQDSKNPVDIALAAHFESLGLKPAKRCSDSVFIRRATLDLTGRIPSPERLIFGRRITGQAREARGRTFGVGRICKLHVFEARRHSENQGGVPYKPVAECGAGVHALYPQIPLGRLGVGRNGAQNAVVERQQF